MKENYITIYPNPVTDNLFIDFATNNFLSSEVIITDATGKNVLIQNITSTNAKINIASFSKGIYFVSIKLDDAIIHTDSFVKQ
ncbi:MAG: T9SS type A sorting domain-containing protein [Chitinophagales bacterium]|nr:T9SS type A sorting domain-containing protein [Chitinophagales bacterium]